MILIDFSSVTMQTLFSKYPKSEPKYETVRRHVIKRIKSYEAGSYFGKIIICCDSPPYWRKEYFKYYKANRKRGEFGQEISNITQQLIHEFREKGPWYLLRVKNCEADDIIGQVVKRTPKPHLIVSRDSDFKQLLDGKRVVLDCGQRIMLNKEEAKEELLEKIIIGDSADFIPNVLSDANTFVKDYKRQRPVRRKDLQHLMENAHKEYPKRFRQNSKLIDLSQIPRDIKTRIKNAYLKEMKVKRQSVKSYINSLDDQYLDVSPVRQL